MSALTSLLVRDQIVSVRKIEEAIQKQVIGGGNLDTILLEMELLDENVLSAYRAALFGLLPATREEVMATPAEVIGLVSKEVAEEHQLVPLVAEERVMVVAVSAPLGADVDEQLSFELEHELVYRIATEPRIAIAIATHYRSMLDPRVERLANRLDRSSPGSVPYVRPPKDNKIDGSALSSFGKHDTVDWEEESRPASSVDVSQVMGVGAAEAQTQDASDSDDSANDPAMDNVADVQAPNEIDDVQWDEPSTRRDTIIDNATGTDQNAEAIASAEEVRRRIARKLRGAITPKKAVRVLGEAAERDEILEVFFRFARQFFDCTVVFVVQDDHAIARLEYRDGQRTRSDRRVSMTANRAFAELRRSPMPLSTGRAHVGHGEDLATAVDRPMGKPAILLPVALRGRAIVVLYGDRAGDPFGIEDLPELMAFVPRVSESLEKLIIRRKHDGYGSAQSRDRASLKSAAGRVLAVGVKGEEDKTKRAYRGSDRPNGGSNPRSRRDGPLAILGVPRSAPPPPSSSAPSAREPKENQASQRDDIYSSPDTQAALSAPKVPSETRSPNTDPAPPPKFDGTAPQRPSRTPRSPSEYSLRDAGSDVLSAPPPRKSRRPDPRAEGQAPSEEQVNIPSSMVTGPPARAPRSDAPAEETEETTPSTVPPPRKASAAKRPSPTPDEGPSAELPAGRPADVSAATATSPGGQPSVIVTMGEGVEELATELLDCGPDDEGPIVSSLLHLGEASLPALIQRFPGPLWFDRNRPHRRLPRGRDVSAVCRALVAFGPRAVPYIGSLLSKPNADVRFYATLLASEVVAPELVPLLGERVFDDDDGTQVLAIDVLRHFKAFPALEETLKRIRLEARAVGREPRRRRTAARALGELRDARSLEILIDLLASSDPELVETGHHALVTLTRQDFGTSVRRWLSWAEKSGGKHRIEWLIESLLHSDEHLRAASADELKSLSQEYFGYHPSSPKKDREVAQRKYRKWWNNEGRTRFSG